MRRFAFFMAFLLLTLSCMPCGDDFLSVAMEIGQSEISQFPASHKDSNSAKDADTCPPFCQCSCCASFSINDGITSLSIPDRGIAPDYFSYLPLRIIKIALPVWQPPQLV